MLCPAHGDTMTATETRYGPRHAYTVDGCSVVCWDGRTSTPADAETRQLRHKCHEAFDPLWKEKRRFRNRWRAYKWLIAVMGTRPERTHIGMFDRQQCMRLLELLERQRLMNAK